ASDRRGGVRRDRALGDRAHLVPHDRRSVLWPGHRAGGRERARPRCDRRRALAQARRASAHANTAALQMKPRTAYDRAMPRGADPEDAELFAPRWIPVLRTATAELSWLLSRGYAETSALALVGNRHALRRRQRDAVRRCACADAAREARLARRVD